MKDRDVIRFKEYQDGEIQVYVEDSIGHHVSIILKKNRLLKLLQPILLPKKVIVQQHIIQPQ